MLVLPFRRESDRKNIKGTPKVYRNVVEVGSRMYSLWEYVVIIP